MSQTKNIIVLLETIYIVSISILTLDWIFVMSSVFTKIINRELPANIVYEDKNQIVITDHRPKDIVHLLIIFFYFHRFYEILLHLEYS